MKLEFEHFQGRRVRIVWIDGKPWWVVADLCAALDRVNKANITSSKVTDAIGRQRLTRLVNDIGVYELVLASRKPEAQAFKDWLAGVLTTIRKTGRYTMPTTEAAPSLIAAMRQVTGTSEAPTPEPSRMDKLRQLAAQTQALIDRTEVLLTQLGQRDEKYDSIEVEAEVVRLAPLEGHVGQIQKTVA
jgi:prophage antirepressor-like protein